ncbi:phage tail protein [Pseudomonas sp. CC120222-01a]|uniref:phage tail protein n=1 Tax=Pseudomonas sp. CC120222-01a TaxID=1378075 RepID=UPI000D872356|nr:tail fiber protein [Pseudomonas sp. CC120222-01a]PVZ39078.1 microcystin-dependent protein [Pseudomonas sp. CC120222-01a]
MADPFLGEIRMVGFNFNPYGWALCQGQVMSLSQNTALFALLGTTYGGDGVSNFALPDLRSRTPVGWGQGNGLSVYELGEQGGTEHVTQTLTNMPPHTHLLNLTAANNLTATNNLGGTTVPQVVNADATSATPIAGGCLGIANDGTGTTFQIYHSGKDNAGNPLPRVDLATQALTVTGTTAIGGSTTVSGTASVTGTGSPSSVLSPFLALNFIIALQGIFPSRS